ncbi:MAG TPA: ABC transporter substrate-binding protein [Candidatus Scybalocola faecigallinarum]|uniref:ABC transporter substrate-binding protein n=1 Tax=Candidatus Scybalocola faecigallinarum TaxID=2840941 RepID=A0A9D1F378_9FIRM|nr:ABC transporter substrate-binding protein [Candidatus Scybalocola faecigallinarum]
MKRRLAFVLSCLLAVGTVAGCGGSNDNGGSAADTNGGASASAQESAAVNDSQETASSGSGEGETLTVALALEPASLMPTAAGANEAYMVMNCMAETLFKWNSETGEIEANLGDFEWVDDTHFRVTLKDGIHFQNGEELTTEDVLYTFQVNNEYSSGNYEVFNLENTVIEDDHNMVFETKESLAQAPERFVQESYFIFSKKTLEEMGGAENTALYPIDGYGTGKYQFKEWVSGQYILLEKNDDYWNQEDMPYYDYIKFVFVNDSASRAMAVESGDANVGSNLPVSQAPIYENSDVVDVHYMDTQQCGTVFMNCSRGPLQDERVREAIWNLIDVNALNQLAANGMGRICETTISPYSIVYDPEPEGTVREVNVEKAKELLAEAGYPDGFTLEMTNMATQQAQGEIIQENLRQAGIEVNITINETPTHFQWLREGNYDLTISNLSPMYYTENLRLVDGRISTAVVYGGANYKDENFYPLLDAAYSAFDMDDRIAAYKACQDYMKEHRIVVGTHTTVKLELTSEGLTAPGLTAMGNADYTVVRPQ